MIAFLYYLLAAATVCFSPAVILTSLLPATIVKLILLAGFIAWFVLLWTYSFVAIVNGEIDTNSFRNRVAWFVDLHKSWFVFAGSVLLVFVSIPYGALATAASVGVAVYSGLTWWSDEDEGDLPNNNLRNSLRGAKLGSGTRTGGQIKLGGVVIPVENENRHLLSVGTTGTGKTQAIVGVLRDARRRGDRGICFDVGGGYLSHFYRQGDVILNPLDARSVGWNPFADVSMPYEWDSLAKAAIPDASGAERSWNFYAQVLFAAVGRGMQDRCETGVKRLVYLLSAAAPEELQPYLDGTPAAILASAGNEKMFANTRAVISTYITPWTFLPDGGTWSLRQWIRQGQTGGWLFITYRDNQTALLRQFLSMLMALASEEILSLNEDPARRIWLVADELDTLGRVQGLKDFLTKSRKYGGCMVAGIQTIAQLRDSYGREGAQVLLSCLSNHLLLRAGDPDTAQWCSDALGQHQIVRAQRGEGRRKTGFLNMLLGSSDARETENVTYQTVTEPLVLPSEFQNLPDRVGYLNLAGEHSIVQVQIPVVALPNVVEPFVEARHAPGLLSTRPAIPVGVPATTETPFRVSDLI